MSRNASIEVIKKTEKIKMRITKYEMSIPKSNSYIWKPVGNRIEVKIYRYLLHGVISIDFISVICTYYRSPMGDYLQATQCCKRV